ncbi:MAG: hypothetical protein BGN85_05180 [Alphaproteobacteria bacterium 64-11]|nr:hypothetical protein [Alphaproteobacteria bacterium]OJU14183.1 MAG: hypothetical protein BGN85_05180 [Alphaproteobacteria bacterium 64-11]
MSIRNIVPRAVAAILWAAAIFEIFGGAFVWRVPLHDRMREGGNVSYNFSLYRLPPPPQGPPYCDIVTIARLSFAMPCDFRPPFIDLAKKYL